MNVRRILLIVVLFILGGFVLLQFVPYGHAHENPPVVQEPNWDSAQTRELAQRACFDCHSNETVWPWYSNIAPASWLVQHDVDEGRQYLNFSDWNHSGERGEGEGTEPEELGEVILEGEMPPAQFLLTHPEARLTDAEKQALAAGLQITAGGSPVLGGEGGEEGDED